MTTQEITSLAYQQRTLLRNPGGLNYTDIIVNVDNSCKMFFCGNLFALKVLSYAIIRSGLHIETTPEPLQTGSNWDEATKQ